MKKVTSKDGTSIAYDQSGEARQLFLWTGRYNTEPLIRA